MTPTAYTPPFTLTPSAWAAFDHLAEAYGIELS